MRMLIWPTKMTKCQKTFRKCASECECHIQTISAYANSILSLTAGWPRTHKNEIIRKNFTNFWISRSTSQNITIIAHLAGAYLWGKRRWNPEDRRRGPHISSASGSRSASAAFKITWIRELRPTNFNHDGIYARQAMPDHHNTHAQQSQIGTSNSWVTCMEE